MTEEEKEKLILEITERILLRIPEVLGNLMAHHATINKEKKAFFNKYPEFKRDLPTVTSVIEKIEGDDLSLNFNDVLERSVPEIQKRLKLVDDLNFDKPEQEKLNLNITDNADHGVI